MRSRSRLRQKETGRLRYINNERTARFVNRGISADTPAILFGLRSGAIIVTNGFSNPLLLRSFFGSRRTFSAMSAARHDANVALFERAPGSCSLGVALKRPGDFKTISLMHDQSGPCFDAEDGKT